MTFKNIISLILKIVTTKNFYNNRHKSRIFWIYHNFELFFKTFKLRMKNLKLFFIPTKHLIAAHLYKKISKFFINNNIEFLLFGGTLLGVSRGQNACAGSAKDLDIAIIFNYDNRDKFLEKLFTYFNKCTIRKNNNHNSIHINFNEYHYYVDIAYFFKNIIMNGMFFFNFGFQCIFQFVFSFTLYVTSMACI